MHTCKAKITGKIFCSSQKLTSLGVLGEYARHVLGVFSSMLLRDIIFDVTWYFVHPDQTYFRSSNTRLDGLNIARKPSHATVPLKEIRPRAFFGFKVQNFCTESGWIRIWHGHGFRSLFNLILNFKVFIRHGLGSCER